MIATLLRRLKSRYVILAALVLLAGCDRPQVYTQESYVFGTRVQISIYGLEEAVAAKHASAVLKELDRLHAIRPQVKVCMRASEHTTVYCELVAPEIHVLHLEE